MVTVDIHLVGGWVRTIFVDDDVCLTEIAKRKDAFGTPVAIYAYIDSNYIDGLVWDPEFSNNWKDV